MTISSPLIDVASLPDINTTAGKLADLKARRAEATYPMGRRAVDKVHQADRLTARERLDFLLDEGSFIETDQLARHRTHAFGMGAKRPATDGIVTGWGTIDGREVCVFSQDGTVFGGALGEVYGEKMVKIMELAVQTGRPLIGLYEGAGARIQDGAVSLDLIAQTFYHNINASGVVPQISVIMGACAGGLLGLVGGHAGRGVIARLAGGTRNAGVRTVFRGGRGVLLCRLGLLLIAAEHGGLAVVLLPVVPEEQ